jgi:hypothetical protein
MVQYMPPQGMAQLLQSTAGLQDDASAAAVFSLDGDAAAAGDAAPFTLLQAQKQLAAEQQQQGRAEAGSKAANPELASAAANNATAESEDTDSAKAATAVGPADPAELSALLRVSPPAGTVDSWQCVLEAHPQGLDEDMLADMTRQAGSSSSSSSSSISPSPVQSWLLPQLLDEDRPALLVCEPAAAAGSSSAGDAATAVALVAAAEIAAIEALAARSEAVADEETEYQDDDGGSSSAVQQQLLPWELDEADEDESGAGQRRQSEVHAEGQGKGSEVQGEDDEDDEDEEDEDEQWEGEQDPEEGSEEDGAEAAAEDAACVPYMLWLCRSAAAAEQAAAQHSSMLAAAGVRAVTLDAALVQQLVETNDKGIDLQDQLNLFEPSESLVAAANEKRRLQGWFNKAERLLQAVVAAKADNAAAQESTDTASSGFVSPPETNRYAEAVLRHDLEVLAEKLAAADAAVAAAKQYQAKEQEALQQQLDAVQLQLGELYAALGGQLGGSAVVFAGAGVLLEAVESSQGVVGLGSVRWLVADSCRGLGDPAAAAAAAAAAAGDVDAESGSDEEEEQRDDDGYATADANAAAADEDESYHDRLLQLAKLLPGGRDSDSSRDSVGAWQLQDSSQAARLVYITQVRCCTLQHNMLYVQQYATCSRRCPAACRHARL